MTKSLRSFTVAATMLAVFWAFCSYGSVRTNELEPRNAPQFLPENKSHSVTDVKFQSRNAAYTTYFTNTGLILAGFTRAGDAEEYFELQVHLRDAQKEVEITTLNPILAGNDLWLTSLPDYARIKYANIYPRIDMLCYGNPDQLEMQFVIAPGGDPHKIHFQMLGADQVSVTPEGALLLMVRNKAIEMPPPVAFQAIDESGANYVVEARYVKNSKNEVSLRLGPYNSRRTLVINP